MTSSTRAQSGLRVTDPELTQRLRRAFAARYGGFDDVDGRDDPTWYFHYAPR